NESTFDLQLQGLDGRMHLLARNEIAAVDREKTSLMPPVAADNPEFPSLLAYLSRLSGGVPDQAVTAPAALPGEVSFARITDPKPGDWPTYHGVLTGNRHSPLHQIDAA